MKRGMGVEMQAGLDHASGLKELIRVPQDAAKTEAEQSKVDVTVARKPEQKGIHYKRRCVLR